MDMCTVKYRAVANPHAARRGSDYHNRHPEQPASVPRRDLMEVTGDAVSNRVHLLLPIPPAESLRCRSNIVPKRDNVIPRDGDIYLLLLQPSRFGC